MIDGNLRTIHAVGEPVRGSRIERRRFDLRGARSPPQLFRSRHGRAIDAGLHTAPVVEKEARVGSHGDQSADGDKGDHGRRQDLTSLTVPLLVSSARHARPLPRPSRAIRPG